MCQVNISAAFSGKPIEPEEFLNRIVEVLGVIIDVLPKKNVAIYLIFNEILLKVNL